MYQLSINPCGYGKRYGTTAVVARKHENWAFICGIMNYDAVERDHGRLVAQMVRELKALPEVGDIFIERNEIEVFPYHDYQRLGEDVDWVIRRYTERLYAEQNPDRDFRLEIRNYWDREFHSDTEIAKTSAVYSSYSLAVREKIVRENGVAIADMVRDLFNYGRANVDSVLVQPKSITVHIRVHPTKSVWQQSINDIVRLGIAGAKLEMRMPVRSVTLKGTPNNRCRTITTSFTISNYKIHSFARPLGEFDSDLSSLKDLGPEGANLVKKLLKIDGITEVFIEPKQLMIKIGEAFDWESYGITEAIKKAFIEVFGEGIAFKQ